MRCFFISLFALTALIFAGCGGGGGGSSSGGGTGGGNPIFYSVTFYDVGIEIEELAQSVEYGAIIDLKTREKPGYAFDGWQIDGVGDLFNTEYTVTGNTEFHAKFIPLSGTVYQVNFYDEFGGSPIHGLSRPVNAGEPITLPTRTKTGYTFQGWRINNMGSALTGQYTVNQDVSFYAVFTEWIIVSVSVDGIVTERTVTDGSFTVPPAANPDPRFMWNTSSDGLGTTLIPGSIVRVTSDFTIYALMKGDHPNYPIEISDAEEFDNIRNKPNLHYRLVSDISLSTYNTGSGWAPIGTSSTSFSGSLDGDGFKITNLYINTSTNYMGLFGYLTGSVKNLGVETAAGGVKGNISGAIAGYLNDGTITNSYSTGNVSGNSSAGGIAGYVVGGTITNCFSTVNAISSNSEAGGIAGYVINGTITNCYSTGSVSGDCVGGIAGYLYDSTITNNIAANFTITGSNANRIVGYISGTITDNYARLDMLGAFDTSSAGYGVNKTDSELRTKATYESLGWDFASLWHMDNGYGFPRFIWQEVIVNISVDGVVTENSVVGGSFTVPPALSDPRFFGWNTSFDGSGTALTPGDSIPVSAGFTIYALMAGNHPSQPIEISNAAEFNAIRDMPNLHYKLTSDISLSAYNTGSGWTPIGTSSTSPFSGSLDGDGFKITELYINSTSTYMGLFGYLTGSVKNLGVETAAGGVKGYNDTGAIAGYVRGGTITNSYSTGSVSGNDYVGGIAGCVDGGTIKNSYSTVNVNATSSYSDGGGITGCLDGGTITNSYSTGNVSGNNRAGGIAGGVYNSTVRNNVAANTNITGGNYVSRVVGYISGTNTVTNNFANSGMTAVGSAFNTTAANYGVSKSLTDLQTQTTYSDPINGNGLGGLGWQFCDGTTILCDAAHPWKMPSGGTGFPILYWQ